MFHYEQARACLSNDDTSSIAITDLNIAELLAAQGKYKSALKLLFQARAHYLPSDRFDIAYVEREMVACYQALNRFTEARTLAESVSQIFDAHQAHFEQALTLLHLATAEAELDNEEQAQLHLDRAEELFTKLQTATHTASVSLHRSQIALRHGDYALALSAASRAATVFMAHQRPTDYASAQLVQARARLASQQFTTARSLAEEALAIAQQRHVPQLRYAAHLLLGHIANQQQQTVAAIRHYQAAAATINRLQRGLTITMRPGFLEDRDEAIRSLITLYLRNNQVASALNAIEIAKSQTSLQYIANQDQLRWRVDDTHSQHLLEELNQLRSEHHWFYQLATHATTNTESDAIGPATIQQELAQREERMRAITEQLYLNTGNDLVAARVPRLQDIQAQLAGDTLLEYHNDGTHYHVFAIDAQSIRHWQLNTDVATVDHLMSQLQVNIQTALKTGSDSRLTTNLTRLCTRILQRLYQALLAPVAELCQSAQRLVIVPFGALHFLPFHLLHTGEGYLLETHEIVILPSAALLLRQPVCQPAGAVALGDSWDGRLAHTHREATLVAQRTGGNAFTDGAAIRAVLNQASVQILHIAAHGEHRLDQPDLSYIHLADGQLFADDMLQLDMRYELVTLSACETGRAMVAAGDELIGIGRGFLYAGAGAIISSLWRISDESTTIIMDRLYTQLTRGCSKAAALRNAQLATLIEQPNLHPAFWGAFQLVGNPSPLSHQGGSA